MRLSDAFCYRPPKLQRLLQANQLRMKLQLNRGDTTPPSHETPEEQKRPHFTLALLFILIKFDQESLLKPVFKHFCLPLLQRNVISIWTLERVQQICTFIMNLLTLLKHSIYISTGTQCLFQNVIKKSFAILLQSCIFHNMYCWLFEMLYLAQSFIWNSITLD